MSNRRSPKSRLVLGVESMVTVTKFRTRKQAQRTMQLIGTGIVNLLWIKQNSKADGYQVGGTSADKNAEDPTFCLIKMNDTQYEVLLASPGGQCDCIGSRTGCRDLLCKGVPRLQELRFNCSLETTGSFGILSCPIIP
jgi:hypothetical protein